MGTVAAMIIKDMIREKYNPWEEVYDPSRFKPVESAKTLLSQAVEATKGFVGDRILPTHKEASQIGPEEGAIVKIEGKEWQRTETETGYFIHSILLQTPGMYRFLERCGKDMGLSLSWFSI